MKKNIMIILTALLIILSGCNDDIEFIEKEVINYEGQLQVHFIDVGQGDSILVKKDDSSMLIDAGNNWDGEKVVNYLRDQGISKLDFLVGTHPHADHIGGLDDVIDAYDIGKIIMPNAIATTKTFEDVLDSIQNKNMTISKARVGDKYDLDGATIEILAPISDEYSSLNNYSIVLKLTYGTTSYLFTGDAEVLSENEMVNRDMAILKSDVLKLGHHGSSTSTSSEFLDAVDPTYGVITVGEDNDYGHPHREVMALINEKGIKTYRTDLQGTIISVSDGNNISFGTDEILNNNDSQKEEATVVISHIDKIEELVTIENLSEEDVDLTGWKLLSVRGNQEFIFPTYILKANSSVTIASGDASGDLKWGNSNVWSNSESDPGILFDEEGNQVFEYED